MLRRKTNALFYGNHAEGIQTIFGESTEFLDV
jgi:hypothetical protein